MFNIDRLKQLSNDPVITVMLVALKLGGWIKLVQPEIEVLQDAQQRVNACLLERAERVKAFETLINDTIIKLRED